MSEKIDWHSIHPFVEVGGTKKFLDVYSSRIFQINETGVSPDRVFDFGDNNIMINEDFLSKINSREDVFKLLNSGKYFYPVSRYFEDEEVIVIFVLHEGSKRVSFIKNKESGQWMMVNLDNLGFVYLSLEKLNGKHLAVFRGVDENVVSFVNSMLKDDRKHIDFDPLLESNPIIISYEYNW